MPLLNMETRYKPQHITSVYNHGQIIRYMPSQHFPCAFPDRQVSSIHMDFSSTTYISYTLQTEQLQCQLTSQITLTLYGLNDALSYTQTQWRFREVHRADFSVLNFGIFFITIWQAAVHTCGELTDSFFWLVEFTAGILVSQITDLQISISLINSIFPFRKLQIFISFSIVSFRKLQ